MTQDPSGSASGAASARRLADAVFRACDAIGRERWFDKAFDLGCGTGEVGAALAPRIDSIEGVDRSPEMAQRAYQRGCYNHAHAGDMTDFLRGRIDDGADLIVAAGSLAGIDDLSPFLAEVARVLEQHGLFAAMLQGGAAPDRLPALLEAARLVAVVVEDGGRLLVAEQRHRPPVWLQEEGRDGEE